MTALHVPRQTCTQSATYQDVLDAPPHKVAEIIAGTLHLQPRPAARHAWAGSAIASKLFDPFHHAPEGPGGWWIVAEPELHLSEDILVPDFAAWRRETMPVYPDTAFFQIAPDWICEVLSPSTRRHDLTSKRDAYARERVSHLWFADPDARTLEAFELREGVWSLIAALADNATVSLPPFHAISFALGALWPDTNTDATTKPQPSEPLKVGP